MHKNTVVLRLGEQSIDIGLLKATWRRSIEYNARYVQYAQRVLTGTLTVCF